MAKRKKKGAPERRNILVPAMRGRYGPGRGAGSHGDKRKEQSKNACREKVRL